MKSSDPRINVGFRAVKGTKKWREMNQSRQGERRTNLKTAHKGEEAKWLIKRTCRRKVMQRRRRVEAHDRLHAEGEGDGQDSQEGGKQRSSLLQSAPSQLAICPTLFLTPTFVRLDKARRGTKTGRAKTTKKTRLDHGSTGRVPVPTPSFPFVPIRLLFRSKLSVVPFPQERSHTSHSSFSRWLVRRPQNN